MFNHFLDSWNKTYQQTGKGLSYSICSSQLTQLKKNYTWLKEIDSIALQTSLKNLEESFKRFFQGQNNLPCFKSKKNKAQSYTTKFTNNNIEVIGNKIKIPKLGLVKFSKSREVKGRIINATIRKNSTGKYFISLLTEEEIKPLPKTNSICGIDVGIKDFAVLSSGKSYKNPRLFNKLQEKLAEEQRKLARKIKFSKNWHKQKLKVARIHERIFCARNDHLHKLTTEIVKNHDIIGVEDLQVVNMVKNRKLSKSISDASWSKFKALLTYKANWYGKTVIPISKKFPSSQLCSNCGYKNKKVKDLSIRKWTCSKCNITHSRDLNASKNIEHEAIRITTVGTTGVAQ